MIQNKIIRLINKVKFIFLLLLIYISSGVLNGQNVAINNTGALPNSSALLDISSTNKGFLIPRMTHAEMLAIAAPATSLLVYSTTDLCFYFYTGAAWQILHCTCLGAPVMSITGNATPCQGSSQIYTASLVSGSPPTSYVWTVPAGATITAGQGTATITVTWGANSGTISLITSNNCGTSAATLNITISPLLTSATPITGPTALQVCATGNNYSVPVVAGALSYTWSILPLVAGTICTSGQGSNSISVDFGSTAATYTISVYDSNACGISSPKTTLIVTTTVNHGTLTETVPGHYSWVVPCGISSISITMYGARGGKGYRTAVGGTGGKGAKIVATYAVVPGTLLDLYVGAQGTNASSASVAGIGGAGGNAGDESGGNGYGSVTTTWGAGGGGGAASSIRMGGTALANRIFVAAGGGGAGREDNANENGGGGGNVGLIGTASPVAERGLGGTAIAGGAAVLYSPGGCSPTGITGTAGALGLGGNGGMTTASTANTTCFYGGGGGGGAGYYVGSGGCAGGGGGGSSYTDPSATGVTITNNNHAGNGSITIVY